MDVPPPDLQISLKNGSGLLRTKTVENEPPLPPNKNQNTK